MKKTLGINHEAVLRDLLNETPAAAMERERSVFDAAAAKTSKRVVLCGAGNLGRRIAALLLADAFQVLAFADNNTSKWGSVVDGVQVLSPSDAAQRFGDSAVFVICIWHPSATSGISQFERQLTGLGCKCVVPFLWVVWKYADDTLPNYLWDLPSKGLLEAGDVLRAFNLMQDEYSRSEFVTQVRMRLLGDFSSVVPPASHEQYFPDDVYTRIEDECFVDCGAFDGDTIRAFYDFTRGQFRRIIGFEADPRNFSVLQENMRQLIGALDRFICHPSAVGAECGTVRFDASGNLGAHVADQGGIEVPATTLDVALQDEHPTFIKMDIEGAEPDALKGGAKVISQSRPVLAICVYHQQNHLWRIPLQIAELVPECGVFLRPYRYDGYEVVCYGVPKHRMVSR